MSKYAPSDFNNFCVYKHTFPNGKTYVGITGRSPTLRWGRQGCGYRRQPYLWNAIQKYGWDNIKHEILFSGLSQQEAELIEKALLQQSVATYNLAPGGLHDAGRTRSEAARQKMSLAKKGICPEKAHALAIASLKRRVAQCTLDGQDIQIFDSIREAAQAINKHPSGITRCCQGVKKTLGGYVWRYVE